ncbi:hypothetical protein [aff. Roholtiella sp. LEGE 12411]|uniref:hypothetical protein n=1 Tax=aff. Roholtiella sp. LEGE 12411 TaxID=1828822 RepID=UPI00187EE54E|nr:hypothetical protein [aff. Roholtiella sp. LEGE 12411]MBE9037369.1 hypothetical protein [aff. Roholtiella sp. LEGE 12411]
MASPLLYVRAACRRQTLRVGAASGREGRSFDTCGGLRQRIAQRTGFSVLVRFDSSVTCA